VTQRKRSLGPGALDTKKDSLGRTIWVARWTNERRKVQRETLGLDKAVARRRLDDIIAERDAAMRGEPSPMGQRMHLEEAFERWLHIKGAELKEHTVVAYRRELTQILCLIGDLPLRAVTLEHLEDVRTTLLGRGKSARTVNKTLSSLASVMLWAVRRRYITNTPFDAYKRIKENESTRVQPARALTDDEVLRLLDAAREEDRFKCHTVPLEWSFIGLLETGMRYGEFRQLRWSDVDLERGAIRVRAETCKTGVSRVIPIQSELRRVLHHARELLCDEQAVQSEVVFRNPEGLPWREDSGALRKRMNHLLDDAGVPKKDADGQVLHLHAIRHTFATRLARAGVPIQLAQRITGHRKVDVLLQVYTHVEAETLQVQLPDLGGGRSPLSLQESPMDHESPLDANSAKASLRNDLDLKVTPSKESRAGDCSSAQPKGSNDPL